ASSSWSSCTRPTSSSSAPPGATSTAASSSVTRWSACCAAAAPRSSWSSRRPTARAAPTPDACWQRARNAPGGDRGSLLAAAAERRGSVLGGGVLQQPGHDRLAGLVHAASVEGRLRVVLDHQLHRPRRVGIHQQLG